MRFAAAQGKEKWRGKTEKGLAALCVIGLALLLAASFDFYYDLNDDTAMKDILSGTYTGTPDAHAIQMLYPLGWAISLFYKTVPDVPWYGVFLCGCQFAALWTALCCVGSRIGKKERRPIVIFFLTGAAGILFLYEFVFIQYTVTAGLLACAALVRIYCGPDCSEAVFFRYHIATVALIVLAFFLRTEMLLLLTPFLAIGVLFRAGREWPGRKAAKNDTDVRKQRTVCVRHYGVLIGAAALLMGLGLAADGAAYGSPQWREFCRFFDDRTEVYDFYGIPPYEENRDFYTSIGLPEASYRLLENYNFELDDRIDAEMMHEIAQYAAAHQQFGRARRLYESVYAYGYRFAHGEELIFDLFAACTYFVLARASLSRKNAALLQKIALVFGVRTALWLFLLYRGRVVERVTHPLYLIELVTLCLLLAFDTGGLEWKKFEKSAILSLYAVLFVCTAFVHIEDVAERYEQREQVNANWQAWKAYCRERPERFYYMDVYSTVAYSEKLFSDTSPAYRNFDLLGGWCAKSPIAAKKRREAGFDAADDALVTGQALFVADNTKEERDPDFLIAYYREKGTEITIRETDRSGTFSVFRMIEGAARRG